MGFYQEWSGVLSGVVWLSGALSELVWSGMRGDLRFYQGWTGVLSGVSLFIIISAYWRCLSFVAGSVSFRRNSCE